MRTLLLLGLAWGFAYMDRMAITFLSPFVVPDLHLTNFELSALPAALALTWALGAYLIGFWSDRVGARKPFLLAGNGAVLTGTRAFISDAAGRAPGDGRGGGTVPADLSRDPDRGDRATAARF